MPEATRVYQFGESKIVLTFGDITTSKAHVLVSSDDYLLTMGGGVSAAIRKAGGSAIGQDAAKQIPLGVGDVAVTSAGALPARFIFHAVTLGPGVGVTAALFHEEVGQIVRETTSKCLALLEPLGVSSIAFPAIGAGTARFPIADIATHMAKTIASDLLARPDPIEATVYFLDRQMGPPDFSGFFEEFARRTPTIAGRAVDPSLPSKLGPLDDSRSQRRLQQIGRRELVEVFVSYSHADEPLRQHLVKHLSSLRREGAIADWHDREITGGSEWAAEIDRHLDSARVILMLLSADFMDSDYCLGIEMERALERHRAGDARVIPVVLRAVDWTHSPLGRLQALPRDARPVTLWPDQDSAFMDIAQGVRTAIQQLMLP